MVNTVKAGRLGVEYLLGTWDAVETFCIVLLYDNSTKMQSSGLLSVANVPNLWRGWAVFGVFWGVFGEMGATRTAMKHLYLVDIGHTSDLVFYDFTHASSIIQANERLWWQSRDHATFRLANRHQARLTTIETELDISRVEMYLHIIDFLSVRNSSREMTA